MKNKSDSSIGEKALRIETNLSVRRDSGEELDKETPDVVNDCLQSKAEEFVSARILLPDNGYERTTLYLVELSFHTAKIVNTSKSL